MQMPPSNQRGPKAWDNATSSPPGHPQVLRLLVHGVTDRTNLQYAKEVREFLEKVKAARTPFSTDRDVDWALARELDWRCYTLRASLGKGSLLFY